MLLFQSVVMTKLVHIRKIKIFQTAQFVCDDIYDVDWSACDEDTLQDELRSVMLSLGQPLSDQQLRDMIAYADLDGDGKINLKEFIKIMTTDTKLVSGCKSYRSTHGTLL